MRHRTLALLGLFTLLASRTEAASITPHPYFMTGSYGVFAMASAGQWTGNGTSPTTPTNYGFNAATSQIILSTGTGPQSANAFYATTPGNFSSSSADASIGLFHVSNHFVNGDAIPALTAASHADAGWFDTLTFSAPGLDGQPGTMAFAFHVSGTLFGGHPNGDGRIQYAAYADRIHPELTVTRFARGTLNGDALVNVLEDPVVSIDFIWGESFGIVLRAVSRTGLASLFGGEPTGSIGDVNFGHSFYWDGLTSVKANGVDVAMYDLVSGSGADYRQSFAPAAVPEPGAGLLSIAGIAVAAGLRRRRRARPS